MSQNVQHLEVLRQHITQYRAAAEQVYQLLHKRQLEFAQIKMHYQKTKKFFKKNHEQLKQLKEQALQCKADIYYLIKRLKRENPEERLWRLEQELAELEKAQAA